MIKTILSTSILALAGLGCLAQNVPEDMRYRRSSIYSLMIKHPEQAFADTIASVFLRMPVPDKYNDHDLSVKVVSTSHYASRSTVEDFLRDNRIASRLVSKWFNRDFTNGVCDVELIKSRGVYGASEADKAIADNSVRGRAMLEDAGMELINNTFVMVNDIRYVDKSEKGKMWGGILKAFAAFGAAYSMSQKKYDDAQTYLMTGETADKVARSYKGFTVKICTHLFQLIWDDDAQNTFYNRVYTEEANLDNRDNIILYADAFKLKYVGSQESDGSTTSFIGINSDRPDLMVQKACQRAIDDNVANLQKNFDVFKVKVPLLTVEPLTAPIGKKEGITKNSRFEVLEAEIDISGHTHYKKVGEICPDEDKIWDNRFMATEEGAKNADLGVTTFKKLKGKDFYPGMLIREIR